MIRSFADRATERLWQRERVRSFDARILRTAQPKLAILDVAMSLDDLKVPPGNRLEALRGDRRGQQQYPDQRSMADLLSMVEHRGRRRRDRRPPLMEATMDKLTPVHPGEVLMADFIGPFGITQHRVAVAIGVPPRRINEIVHGKRRISADTALRLSRYFGTSDLFWVNLQAHYDLELERDVLGDALEAIEPVQSA